ncbi:MAG: hypothetical protein JSV19_11515 [Phycisphaerales bacterium]|nr:MAG: hypothetical protein JSV19_11515 [Phycisphaerales bacterium]
MVQKTLDVKLAKIKADPKCAEFIIADAKDADMAYGIAAPGKSPEHHAHEGKFRSLEEYRACIREVVAQGIVDIMLMSAHTNAILTIREQLFENSHVTPAARANDTTDIHVVRGGTYPSDPSCPFQSTTIDHIQCGHVDCEPEERSLGAGLGLYSVTFNNDRDLDCRTLESYKAFRIEAERKGFRHFLEVFDPNAIRASIHPQEIGAFINDMIVRMLAGVPESGRPIFLKMVYHGPRFTEELARYDPSLVIGVLGGSAGTTYDAFKLIAEAKKHGARAALFGRKINNAEHQLAFIEMLRRIVNGEVTPEEAVHAYHGVLQALKIKPFRALDDDLQLTDSSVSYDGGGTTFSVPSEPGRRRPGVVRSAPVTSERASAGRNDRPNLGSMSSAERLAYHRRRLQGTGNG